MKTLVCSFPFWNPPKSLYEGIGMFFPLLDSTTESVSRHWYVLSSSGIHQRACMKALVCSFPFWTPPQSLYQGIGMFSPLLVSSTEPVSRHWYVLSSSGIHQRACMKALVCSFPFWTPPHSLYQGIGMFSPLLVSSTEPVSRHWYVLSPSGLLHRACIKALVCSFPFWTLPQSLYQGIDMFFPLLDSSTEYVSRHWYVLSPSGLHHRACIKALVCSFPFCILPQSLYQGIGMFFPRLVSSTESVSRHWYVLSPSGLLHRVCIKALVCSSPSGLLHKVCIKALVCYFPFWTPPESLYQGIGMFFPLLVSSTESVSRHWYVPSPSGLFHRVCIKALVCSFPFWTFPQNLYQGIGMFFPLLDSTTEPVSRHWYDRSPS